MSEQSDADLKRRLKHKKLLQQPPIGYGQLYGTDWRTKFIDYTGKVKIIDDML